MSPVTQPELSPVVDLEVRPKGEALQATVESGLTIFERMARDPSVDVDKLERLMQMHERATARFAEEQFNGAMTSAQTEMRQIATDAYNPQTKSKYATYAKLDSALRPLYTRHGFGLSFDTAESPLPQHVRVLCYVTHNQGHARTYKADIPADGKGAKGGDVMTLTHAFGAATAYGMRYLLKMIFNVAIGEEDRDGNMPRETADPPAGYEKWFTEFKLTAPNGLAALTLFFQGGKPEYRDFLTKHDAARKAEIQAAARKAGR